MTLGLRLAADKERVKSNKLNNVFRMDSGSSSPPHLGNKKAPNLAAGAYHKFS
jgi:hypothetical protein